MLGSKRRKSFYTKIAIVVVVMGIVLSFIPQLITAYLLTVFIFLFMYVIQAESYDIFSGYSGYYNLGHGAFFGLGAYTFGVLSGGLRGGYAPVFQPALPIYITIPAAVLIAVAFAAGMTVPFFRLRGAYFSVASFSLVLLLSYLASNLRAITGGPEGLQLLGGGDISTLESYYLLAAGAIASILVNYFVSKSRLGLALVSIREDEEVASEYGINTFTSKAKALLISAAFSGFAGAAFGNAIGVINPSGMLGLEIALAPVIMTIFGGVGSFAGALLGAVVLTVIQEGLWTQIAYFHLFTYGVLVLVVGLLAPGGIVRLRGIRRLFKPPE